MKYKKILLVLLVLLICINGFNISAEEVSVKTAIDRTAELFLEQMSTSLETTGSEWKLIGLIRSGVSVSESYKENYYNNLCGILKQKNGVLSANNYNEYSRSVLGVTVLGKDAKNIDGYDLTEYLSDYKAVSRQTVNVTAWALIALDSNNYDISDVSVEVLTSRSALIQHLIDKQLDDGGWAIFGKKGDIDVTAMVLTAISRYYDENTIVKQSADRAAKFLSEKQNDDGGYTAWNVTSSESIAQVIVALCSVGISPDTDSRFVKNGKSLVDALMDFFINSGGFCHLKGEGFNQTASEQGLYALAAYKRLTQGKSPLFDMRDIFQKEKPKIIETEEIVTVNSTTEYIAVKEKNNSYDKPTDSQKNNKDNPSNETTVFELRKQIGTAPLLKNTSKPVEPKVLEKKSSALSTTATEPAVLGKVDLSKESIVSAEEKKSTKKKTDKTSLSKKYETSVQTGTAEKIKEHLKNEDVTEPIKKRSSVIYAVVLISAVGLAAVFIFGKRRKQ